MVYAAVDTTPKDPLAGGPLASSTVTLAKVFGLIMNVVLGVGIALTVIYLILGGIKYITSQGDQKNTQTAREWLTNAVIGFIIVLAAFAIKSLTARLLGADTSGLGDVSPVN